MISKELLSEVLNQNVTSVYKQQEQYRYTTSNTNGAWVSGSDVTFPNIYELAHKNLKQWAKLKNVFDIIDWSEEPEQIFKKAEELRNEIN